jgi:hypothetical protein
MGSGRMNEISRRDLIGASGAVAVAAVLPSAPSSAAIPGQAAPVDRLRLIHPELRQAAARMPTLPKGFVFTDRMLPQMRKGPGLPARAALPDIAV